MKTTILLIGGCAALILSGCHRHHHVQSAGHSACACQGDGGGHSCAMKGHGGHHEAKGHRGQGHHGMKKHGTKRGRHDGRGPHHGMRGHEGMHGKMDKLPPLLIAYHDSFASAWHPQAEEGSTTEACQVVPVLTLHAGALAGAQPPAGADKAAWAAASADLKAKTTAVDQACSNKGDVGAALAAARTAFHALAATTGAVSPH